MGDYRLMHKDRYCGTISLDPITGNVLRADINEYGPYLGHADLEKMKRWWTLRAVPASRNIIKDILKKQNILTPTLYLAKNLGLSMTDTYWICPVDARLSWEDVNLRNFKMLNYERIPYHNASSYDPNASLGGQMEKYWDLTGEKPVLVKESYKYFGQQSLNEVFATLLHESQPGKVPYVSYWSRTTADRGVLALCEAFTSENVEFIPAYEVVGSRKKNADLLGSFIVVCKEEGLSEDIVQRYMDYQILTDFIISNTDEHLQNFGILRDADTGKLLSPAPVFDSGNSMFFAEFAAKPWSRSRILEMETSGIFKREEKGLARVVYKDMVDLSCCPTKQEVAEFYASSGVPEEKAAFIAENYQTKLDMVHEFQHGKKISLYLEKGR